VDENENKNRKVEGKMEKQKEKLLCLQVCLKKVAGIKISSLSETKFLKSYAVNTLKRILI
jgi:hypothetical protein